MKENRVNSCHWVSLLCCHELSFHFYLLKICLPYPAEIKLVNLCNKFENKLKIDAFAMRSFITSVTDILKAQFVFTACNISSSKLNFKKQIYINLSPRNQEKLQFKTEILSVKFRCYSSKIYNYDSDKNWKCLDPHLISFTVFSSCHTHFDLRHWLLFSMISFRLKLTFSCMMDLSKFPLDSQVCTMEVASCKCLSWVTATYTLNYHCRDVNY